MNKSSMRGIFLSVILLFSVTVITIPLNAYADEIDVKSFGLEDTTIMEITNNSNTDVNSFRIWLGEDSNFKSFKTEKGWVGEKTPQGVIIFTSSEPIGQGESIKIGVKTDIANPGINWKALDNQNNQKGIGKVLQKDLPEVSPNPKIKAERSSENEITNALQNSNFRVIPDKPNIGSLIRITGDSFPASQNFDFYIDSKIIGSFETGSDGKFVTTMKIPDNQKAERVDLKIEDKFGDSTKISLRIGDITSRIVENENVKLAIFGIPKTVNHGDVLEMSGTGKPNSTITIKTTAIDGKIIKSTTAKIDPKGNWELDEKLIISPNMQFGKYMTAITDGKREILKHWTIETDKVIIVTPINIKFEPGEIMKFEGTVLPNNPINVSLEDPLGNEISSEIIEIDETGNMEFEYVTELSAKIGTYTLTVTQKDQTEFIFVGLGENPSNPINISLDKLNYKNDETAIISVIGNPSETISMLILDPADKPIGESIQITIEPQGTAQHLLELTEYQPGVYTLVINKGSAQSTEIFSVGLQTGSGEINISTTKQDYHIGDSILILGDTDPNSLVTITMVDPNGNKIKEKMTFSDKHGKILESSFKIPTQGNSGIWKINAKSGPNFTIVDLNVIPELSEGIQITVEEGAEVIGSGKTIQIRATGVQQTVLIEIISEQGEIMAKLSSQASTDLEINQPWIIPKDAVPGTYTIKITDAVTSSEINFEVK